MDNRLKEVIDLKKSQIEGCLATDCAYCKIDKVLVDYAEQGLKLEGVMPQKLPINPNSSHCSQCGRDFYSFNNGYNKSIDDCTHALIQKLDGLEEVMVHMGCSVARARQYALSIKEYLQGDK